MKISIKREQSQAGLSFAEREKFRPQVKNKLFLLLALLLTAATGAWATDVYVVGNGDGNWLNGVAWDTGAAGNKMTEQNGVYSITYKDVDANSELLFKFAINGSWDVNYGCTSWDANELNKTLSNIEAGGANFKFGLTEKADVTISFNLSELTYMISTKGMKVGDDAATGYTVSMKDDVKDADKWTVKVGEGQAQALPIGGLKGDGSETVTLQYNGRLKVKGVKATSDAAPAANPIEVLTYSFDDASHPSGLTAGSRVSFDYSRTSVITNSKFLNAYNNANGDPNATTVSLGDTDLSGETWTLSFEWAACGGCNSKPDHTTLKAGDATLFDLSGNSNWNTTVTIIYTGSDGSKTLPVPGCDKSNRWTAAVGDQYNTTTYWHHIVVTGSAEGVKMTITNSSTGAAVVEDVVLSETNVNPTSLIIEPSCGGGIGIDALSLTYEE